MNFFEVLLLVPFSFVCIFYGQLNGNDMRKVLSSLGVFLGGLVWAANGPGLTPIARSGLLCALSTLVLLWGLYGYWTELRMETLNKIANKGNTHAESKLD